MALFMSSRDAWCFTVLITSLTVVISSAAVDDMNVNERCPTNLPSTTITVIYNKELCLQYVSEEKYWSEARNYCLEYGGRLVKIDSAAKNSFILKTLGSTWWQNNGIWIGLHDKNVEMEWQWTGFRSKNENEPSSWTNWARGHPGTFLHSGKDCVRMVRSEWTWHETMCGIEGYRFICEYKLIAPRIATTMTSSPPSTYTVMTSPSLSSNQKTSLSLSANQTRESSPTYEVDNESDRSYHNQSAHGIENDNDNLPNIGAVKVNEKTTSTLKVDADIPRHAEQKSDELQNSTQGLIIIGASCAAFCLILTVIVVIIMRRLSRRKEARSLPIPFVASPSVCPNKKECCGEESEWAVSYEGALGGPESCCSTCSPHQMGGGGVRRAESNVYLNPARSNAYCSMSKRDVEDRYTPTSAPLSFGAEGYMPYVPCRLAGEAVLPAPPTDEYLCPIDMRQKQQLDSTVYDSPKFSNIYSEVPEHVECNIYEALDDVKVLDIAKASDDVKVADDAKVLDDVNVLDDNKVQSA